MTIAQFGMNVVLMIQTKIQSVFYTKYMVNLLC